MSKRVVDTYLQERNKRWRKPWPGPPSIEWDAMVHFIEAFDAHEYLGGGIVELSNHLLLVEELTTGYTQDVVYLRLKMFHTLRHVCSGLSPTELNTSLWEELKDQRSLIEHLEIQREKAHTGSNSGSQSHQDTQEHSGPAGVRHWSTQQDGGIQEAHQRRGYPRE